jgi:hypothetical protein
VREVQRIVRRAPVTQDDRTEHPAGTAPPHVDVAEPATLLTAAEDGLPYAVADIHVGVSGRVDELSALLAADAAGRRAAGRRERR